MDLVAALGLLQRGIDLSVNLNRLLAELRNNIHRPVDFVTISKKKNKEIKEVGESIHSVDDSYIIPKVRRMSKKDNT